MEHWETYRDITGKVFTVKALSDENMSYENNSYESNMLAVFFENSQAYIFEKDKITKTTNPITGRDCAVFEVTSESDIDENIISFLNRSNLRATIKFKNGKDTVVIFGKTKIFLNPFRYYSYKISVDIESEDIEIPSDTFEIIETIKDLDNITSKSVLKNLYKTLSVINVDLLYDKNFLDDDDFIKIYKMFKDEKIIPEILREDFKEIYGGN